MSWAVNMWDLPRSVPWGGAWWGPVRSEPSCLGLTQSSLPAIHPVPSLWVSSFHFLSFCCFHALCFPRPTHCEAILLSHETVTKGPVVDIHDSSDYFPSDSLSVSARKTDWVPLSWGVGGTCFFEPLCSSSPWPQFPGLILYRGSWLLPPIPHIPNYLCCFLGQPEVCFGLLTKSSWQTNQTVVSSYSLVLSRCLC